MFDPYHYLYQSVPNPYQAAQRASKLSFLTTALPAFGHFLTSAATRVRDLEFARCFVLKSGA